MNRAERLAFRPLSVARDEHIEDISCNCRHIILALEFNHSTFVFPFRVIRDVTKTQVSFNYYAASYISFATSKPRFPYFPLDCQATISTYQNRALRSTK